jgi:colanic acid biosynthesis glycosyl transferase WcaI
MRLLFLSLNYSPEPTGFAPHTTALAEHLVARGHAVRVVAGFPFAPGWVRWASYRREFLRRETVNGVGLVRISHFIPRQPGAAIQRIMMEGSFSLLAAVILAATLLTRRGRPDIIVYVGAQPAIAMLARLIAQLIRVPYVVNINDLAAQAASDVGILGSGFIRRALERFEYAAYARAAGATVLCKSFSEALRNNGYPVNRIRLIRSPVDLNQVRPVPQQRHFRTRLGIPDNAFVLLFSGSMGLKQGLSNVIKAAHRLITLGLMPGTICWVLVGDGETRDSLVRSVREHRLEQQVVLLPFQPENALSEMYAAADVLLLNQIGAVKDTVVPSKLLTYMAAGRPVLAAVNRSSQGAEILRQANGGIIVKPDDPDALVSGAEALLKAPKAALEAMATRNRLYAEQHFDQHKILAAHEQFIQELLHDSLQDAVSV